MTRIRVIVEISDDGPCGDTTKYRHVRSDPAGTEYDVLDLMREFVMAARGVQSVIAGDVGNDALIKAFTEAVTE